MILLLGKWALVIGPLLMIPLKLATDCRITTQLLLLALPHRRRPLQMGRSKMTPALSESISEPLPKHFPSVLHIATKKISYKLAGFQWSQCETCTKPCFTKI